MLPKRHNCFFNDMMMRLSALVFISLLYCIFPCRTDAQKTKAPVLIVDGFSNHDWRQTTKVTKWILESSGLFTVEVSTVPMDSMARSAWRADFSKYALVVQNT